MSILCPKPANEDLRLAALEALDIFDTRAEARFDRLVRLAADLLDVPIALMPLVGASELRFKATHGLEIERNDRDKAFCAFTIMEQDVLVVPDATADPRFRDNPGVGGEEGFHFYAGAPLDIGGGLNVGALCVLDTKPRFDFCARKQRILAELAAIITDEMTLRAELERRERAAADRTSRAEFFARTTKRSRERFMALVGHELRTPLNAILGFAQVMEAETLGPLGNDRYRRFSASIVESGKRLSRTIEQLATFSNLETGSIKMFDRAFDLDSDLDAVMTALAPDAALSDIALHHQRTDAPLMMVADRQMVTQMLFQIIGNAIKFSPAGGVVTVSTIRDEDGETRIVVKDRGEGIEPDTLQKALRAFETTNGDRDHPLGGVGLGLPLTNTLLDRHGGRLELKPRHGGGCRAVLVFPGWRANVTCREAGQIVAA